MDAAPCARLCAACIPGAGAGLRRCAGRVSACVCECVGACARVALCLPGCHSIGAASPAPLLRSAPSLAAGGVWTRQRGVKTAMGSEQ